VNLRVAIETPIVLAHRQNRGGIFAVCFSLRLILRCDRKIGDNPVNIGPKPNRTVRAIVQFRHYQGRLCQPIYKNANFPVLNDNPGVEPRISIRCRFQGFLELAGFFLAQFFPRPGRL
jgi:hypothetical protein